MPNPNLPNLGTSLANTGFSKPEPGFFESGGGFGGLTGGIRNVTRNLAAGFAKDPAYRQQAAQQLAIQEQAQQEQVARMRQAVVEASLDNLGTIAESVRGLGEDALMQSPSTLKFMQRALESTKQSLLANGWDEADAAQLVEQYGQRLMFSANTPKEMSDDEKKVALYSKLGYSENEIKKGLGTYIAPEKTGLEVVREVKVPIDGSDPIDVKIYSDGSTNLLGVDANQIDSMAGGQSAGGGYLGRLAQLESASGANTDNPLNPNVTGKYQIDRVKSWPQLEGVDDESAIKVVMNTNAKEFKDKFGTNPTDADQYGMHRLGAGGYTKLLAADPNASIEDVIGDIVVEDNPDLAGKTALQVRQMFSERMGAGETWRGGAQADLSRFAKEDKPPAQSAAEAEIQRFKTYLGLSDEEAVKLQSGLYVLTAPDANGNVSVIDLSTKKTVKTVNPTAELAAGQQDQPIGETKTPFETSLEEEVIKGTGGLAAVQRFFGATVGQVLSGEEFPDTQEATRNVRAFNNAARKLIAQGITSGSDRLSNQEQYWSMELLPDPDGWLSDPESEAKKVPVLRKNMGSQMQVIDKALKNPNMTRDQRASLTDYRNGLSILINMMGPEPKNDRAALEAEIEMLTTKPADEWTAEDTKRAEQILKELGSGE